MCTVRKAAMHSCTRLRKQKKVKLDKWVKALFHHQPPIISLLPFKSLFWQNYTFAHSESQIRDEVNFISQNKFTRSFLLVMSSRYMSVHVSFFTFSGKSRMCVVIDRDNAVWDWSQLHTRRKNSQAFLRLVKVKLRYKTKDRSICTFQKGSDTLQTCSGFWCWQASLPWVRKWQHTLRRIPIHYSSRSVSFSLLLWVVSQSAHQPVISQSVYRHFLCQPVTLV